MKLLNVKQLSTTNPRFSKYDNLKGTLQNYFTAKAFLPKIDSNNQNISTLSGYTTSSIKDEFIKDNILTLTTQNSIYTYEIMEDKPNE